VTFCRVNRAAGQSVTVVLAEQQAVSEFALAGRRAFRR